MKDALGDYLKTFERRETERRFMLEMPIVARLDGRSFSVFTRGMRRPFDPAMSEAMRDVTRFLLAHSSACLGYTQSDEITLVWTSGHAFFDGKPQKMTSVLAALASVEFSRLASVHWPERVAKMRPVFDCRAFNVPTLDVAAQCVWWRELDATKNAVGMAAAAHYSHRELLGKGIAERHEMLHAKRVNFNDFPAFFKRGSLFARRPVERALTDEERARIPEKHRPAEGALVVRTEVVALDLPPLGRITNRAGVLFRGAEPELAKEAR